MRINPTLHVHQEINVTLKRCLEKRSFLACNKPLPFSLSCTPLTSGIYFENIFVSAGYQPHSNEFSYHEDSYQTFPYDSPISNSSIRNQRAYGHRRTSSNTSGKLGINTNPYHVDTEENTEMFYSPYSRRAGDYSGYFSRQNSIDSTSSERPVFLDIGSTTKLRSSLKRSNYLAPAIRAQNTGGSSSSGPGNYRSQ